MRLFLLAVTRVRFVAALLPFTHQALLSKGEGGVGVHHNHCQSILGKLFLDTRTPPPLKGKTCTVTYLDFCLIPSGVSLLAVSDLPNGTCEQAGDESGAQALAGA